MNASDSESGTRSAKRFYPNASFDSETPTRASIHENESKEMHDHYTKKERLQRIIRNPQKQRELQRKFMQQMTAVKEA